MVEETVEIKYKGQTVSVRVGTINYKQRNKLWAIIGSMEMVDKKDEATGETEQVPKVNFGKDWNELLDRLPLYAIKEAPFDITEEVIGSLEPDEGDKLYEVSMKINKSILFRKGQMSQKG